MQLALPDNHVVGPDLYNQIFTMHGTTMMFIFAVPIMQGMAVYLVPLLVGTRNTAFPRMTACAYWLFLFGALSLGPASRSMQAPMPAGSRTCRSRDLNTASASARTSGTT